jgi:cytidylate kinase
MDRIVVAIDGPSGTGKSTTARLLAAKLNCLYIDSGAMYRAVTLELLRQKIKPGDKNAIVDITKKAGIDFEGDRVLLNGEDVTVEIRSLEVTNTVSNISAIKEIRQILVDKQRNYAKENSVIMDGRDIGTVVFPKAQFKFFLTCDLKTRAIRRQQDFKDQGLNIPLDKIIKELTRRDELDTKRAESPLRKAKDAIEIDTTHMIIEEQVNCLYRIINGLEE